LISLLSLAKANTCGCESQGSQFCNHETSTGECEACSDIADVGACANSGLPGLAAVNSCRSFCFSAEALTEMPSDNGGGDSDAPEVPYSVAANPLLEISSPFTVKTFDANTAAFTEDCGINQAEQAAMV
jgi:hypothetical protein